MNLNRNWFYELCLKSIALCFWGFIVNMNREKKLMSHFGWKKEEIFLKKQQFWTSNSNHNKFSLSHRYFNDGILLSLSTYVDKTKQLRTHFVFQVKKLNANRIRKVKTERIISIFLWSWSIFFEDELTKRNTV